MASTLTSKLSLLVASWPPQTLLIASLALAVVLILILVLIRGRRTSSWGNLVLLVGPQDAGKTAILSSLVYGRAQPTHTSIQPNSSVIPSNNKPIRIVDIPGHPRIREQFTEHLAQAKAIVFVVDASTVSRNGGIVAEHLHHVLHALTSLPPSQPVPSLLILAHKFDLLKLPSSAETSPLSMAIARVRTVLARELTNRRRSQLSRVGVEGLGEEDDEKGEMGGLECVGGSEKFDWDQWEGGPVQFAGTWLKVGEEDEKNEIDEVEEGLQPLAEWIKELS